MEPKLSFIPFKPCQLSFPMWFRAYSLLLPYTHYLPAHQFPASSTAPPPCQQPHSLTRPSIPSPHPACHCNPSTCSNSKPATGKPQHPSPATPPCPQKKKTPPKKKKSHEQPFSADPTGRAARWFLACRTTLSLMLRCLLVCTCHCHTFSIPLPAFSLHTFFIPLPVFSGSPFPPGSPFPAFFHTIPYFLHTLTTFSIPPSFFLYTPPSFSIPPIFLSLQPSHPTPPPTLFLQTFRSFFPLPQPPFTSRRGGGCKEDCAGMYSIQTTSTYHNTCQYIVHVLACIANTWV